MALWTCLNCTTHYAVGMTHCPQCGDNEYQEVGMAKISKAEGATNVGDPNLPPYLDTGEGEQSSVGTVYSESSESPRQSEDTTSHDQSLPAPTTESQSVVGQTESGTADTVGGEMETHRPRRRR